MLAVPDTGCRVWLQGRRVRVENVDGNPIFISDGSRAWDFTGHVDRPRVGSLARVVYLGPSQFLLQRRSTAEWTGSDFAQPVDQVETTDFAGRRCWTVRLAPPTGKPHPLRIWVDIESGQMLANRLEETGVGSEFVDLVVGPWMRRCSSGTAPPTRPSSINRFSETSVGNINYSRRNGSPRM